MGLTDWGMGDPPEGEGGVVAFGFDVLLGTIWNRLELAGTIIKYLKPLCRLTRPHNVRLTVVSPFSKSRV